MRALCRYPEAERACRRAIRILEEDVELRLILAHVLCNLASLHLEYGDRYSQAESVMRRAVELAAGTLGPDDPDLGAMLGNLASAHMKQRHDSQARALFSRALAILEKSPASHQPNTASVLSNLAVLTFTEGDAQGALGFIVRSFALYEQSLGPDHPELVRPLLNLGRCLHGAASCVDG